ncbi:hypothetical protein SLEP1_g57077 [Rubroshorea leprosula]|uniref:Uncharacterized protein n=1 Tax=Rubroshorea leprosula TaxID=152421 RepID=A0AAV5MLC9_9ROSI|nr:hypothetical protein SLEP1_g57077 [Rubroshorea leprosula]
MFAGTGPCLPENSGKLPALPSIIYPCNCCLVLSGFSALELPFLLSENGRNLGEIVWEGGMNFGSFKLCC